MHFAWLKITTQCCELQNWACTAIRRKRYSTHPRFILAMIPIRGYPQPFQKFSHYHCYRAQMLYWCCEVYRKSLTKSTDWSHLSEILQPDLVTTVDPDWEGCQLSSNFTYFTWANTLATSKDYYLSSMSERFHCSFR